MLPVVFWKFGFFEQAISITLAEEPSSVFAISCFHKIVSQHDPCNSKLLNYVLEGIKIICGHTPKKEKPFTPQLLDISYCSLGKDNINLINFRTVYKILLNRRYEKPLFISSTFVGIAI